jgi:hypothetical protein
LVRKVRYASAAAERGSLKVMMASFDMFLFPGND